MQSDSSPDNPHIIIHKTADSWRIKMGEATEFKLEDWAKNIGLAEDTITKLNPETLDTQDVLCQMTEGELKGLQLPLGQKIRLERGISELRGTGMAKETTPQEPEAQSEDTIQQGSTGDNSQPTAATGTVLRDLPANQLMDAGKTLDNLLLGNPAPPPPQAAPAEPILNPVFNPVTVLTNRATLAKPLHIVQFLPDRVRKRLQRMHRPPLVLSSDPSTQIVYREEADKDYQGLNVDEWGSANCRLMYDLTKTGKLKGNEIAEYLAYTAQLFDMIHVYSWRSILDYDYAYRENQAEYGYPWGSYSPHLCHTLIPRQGNLQQTNRQLRGLTGYPTQQETLGKPAPGAPPCQQFLAGHCRFGASCRYTHPPTTRGPESPSLKEELKKIVRPTPGNVP